MSTEMNTGPGAHSILGASGAERYLACPGSVEAQKGRVDKGSVYSREGDTAHAGSEITLLFWKGEKGTTRATQEWSKKATEDGYDVKELVRETTKYVDYVKDLCEGDPDRLTVEQRVSLAPAVPDTMSTADAVVVKREGGSVVRIDVADLKYGKGKQVFAEGNPQLRLYAYGVAQGLIASGDLDDLFDDFDEIPVSIHVCQPRLDHFDREDLTLSELIDWADNQVAPKVEEIINGETSRAAGSHCQFCKAEADCRTRAEFVTAELNDDFDDFIENGPDVSKPDQLTSEEIGRILDNKKAIESWLKAVHAHAYALIENGGEVPGHKIVEGRNARRWEDDEKVLEAFKGQRKLKQDEYAPRKLLTPPQAEKLLPKGSKILDMIVTEKGKPTLVDASNKKPAMSFEPVESMFDDVEEDEDDDFLN